MHTEHLQRVSLMMVLVGWAVAVGLASLIVFIVAALDLVAPESGAATRLQILAVAAGFFAGGLFVGLRMGEAPILHGVAIGLLSLIVWFLLNAVLTLVMPDVSWEALTPELTVTILLLQIVAAVLGARMGYRKVLRAQR